MNRKRRILALCTGNSARSQMGEGLFSHEGGDGWEVFSAGAKPSVVRPEAIAAMREIGIDISGHRSKSADEFAGQNFDYLVTVCDKGAGQLSDLPDRYRADSLELCGSGGRWRKRCGAAGCLSQDSRSDP
jgi:protein-tyrosine-phosphatase